LVEWLSRGVDFDQAIDALERARALTRQWNFRPWAVLARLGYACALSGRADEGRRLLEDVIQDATTMSSMGVGRAMQLAWLGETYLLEGALTMRWSVPSRPCPSPNATRSVATRRGASACSVRLSLGRDHPDVEKVEGYYHDALTLASELGMRPLVAHCHFHLGRLCRKADQQERAREHLTTATTMYREMGMRLWQDLAETEMRQ